MRSLLSVGSEKVESKLVPTIDNCLIQSATVVLSRTSDSASLFPIVFVLFIYFDGMNLIVLGKHRMKLVHFGHAI